MSNSKLATYVRISPFKNSPRNKPISKITWHHMAGVLSVEQFGNIVTTPGREMSATYAIGYDGTIGRFLDESDRPWTSSSPSNDNMAVTLEISNSKMGAPWPISDHVMERAIELTVDICKRNGIKKLVYTGDSSGNFTYHYMFAATGCPEAYIRGKTDYIVNTINKKLGSASNDEPETKSDVKAKDLVAIKSNATYYDGSSMPSWVKNLEWYVTSVSGDRAILGKSKDGKHDINSPVNTKYLTVTKKYVAPAPASNTFKSYTAKIAGGTSIYKDAGGACVGLIKTTSVYTIIAEKTHSNVKYGKLKSGAGWVKTSKMTKTTVPASTTSSAIKKGDWVKVLKNKTYDGGTFVIYASKYKVLELSGKRAVISSDGKNVTAAVSTDNLKKI